MSQGGGGSQFNVDERRSALKKKDVCRGLRRTEGKHIPVCEHSAPMFAIAFDMVDKTALPELARKAIWVINNAYACVEKGEEGAYIKGIPGLTCLMGSKRGVEKTTIQRDDGVNEKAVLKEMNIQFRIHVAESGDAVEHYAILLVTSPLAFSLRKAVWNTLHTKGRGFDGVDADMRRICWNRLATHVRQGFVPSATTSSLDFGSPMMTRGMNQNHNHNNAGGGGGDSNMAGRYTEGEMWQAHDTSVDWIRVPSAESFTCLFNVHRSVDWVCKHFFAKHPEMQQVRLEGFGYLEKECEFVTPVFIDKCRKYDEDVDIGILKTYKKKAKKSQKKKRKNNEADNNNNNNSFDEEAEEEEAGDDGDEVRISVPDPFQCITIFGNDEQMPLDGYPVCDICVEVHMPKTIEGFPSFDIFWSDCKGFPTSVTLDILKKSLQMDLSSSHHEASEEYLTLLESDLIVKGETPTLKRPMLSGGDIIWGQQCRQSLLCVEGASRLEYQRKIVRLAFALGITRAGGSDVYDNKRVEAYGKYMSMAEESVKECGMAFEKLRKHDLNGKGIRLGCCVHEAMLHFTNVVFESNRLRWHLRPDNLYLVIQMMVSDMMLCLNYHDSMIGGACNGIGATLIVRDGGGNYRTLFRKDHTGGGGGGSENAVNMGQIYSKKNGSGADMCVSIYKSVVNMSGYNSKCGANVEGFSELKRTTELGLLQDCCNIIENPNSGCQKQIHTVKDTCGRRYSTELKAGNDPQSQVCIQSIAWLVPRNTTGLDSNCFASTKENDKKNRVSVEYRQVMFGYWVICTNTVGQMSRERFKTLLAVTRSIASATNGIVLQRHGISGDEEDNGFVDACTMVNDTKEEDAMLVWRSVFFGNMCTAVVSGFLQWTGVLGRLPSSPVLEAIMEVFYVHLGKCKDMLNPDMYNPGERGRGIQISKARGVAMSLIMTSMEQTLESGRCKRGQQDAVENTALGLMIQSTSPHMASWIMADTLEHMFRTDLMLLMQMLGTKLRVPTCGISLDDVLTWLKTGSMRHCAEMQMWWDEQEKLETAPLDRRTGMTEIGACMYLTHSDLSTFIANPQGLCQVDTSVCSHVGSSLFAQNMKTLEENCQIHGSQGGEEIVQCMLFQTVNQRMPWPSVFGSYNTLPQFWGGNEPSDDDSRRKLTLTPLRIVVTEARKASVFVDARWLLLYCSLCGTVPSQSSRFLGISKWIEHFYHTCIPDRMVCSQWLFTGLPSPVMDCGLLLAPHRLSGRKMLRRPCSVGLTQEVGLNAPIRSGVVEDLGPAALRYQLGEVLKVCERSIPTNAVSYSFPVNQWCPVLLEPENIFASLKWDERERFILKVPGEDERVVSAKDTDEEVFLSGRINVNARPLCMFDRRGVAVMMLVGTEERVGVIIEYDVMQAGYRATTNNNSRRREMEAEEGGVLILNPYEAEDAIIPVHGDVFVRVAAFPRRENYQFLKKQHNDDDDDDVDDDTVVIASRWIRCKLGILPAAAINHDDDDAVICVSANVENGRQQGAFALYGSSHGILQNGRQRLDLEVHVRDVKARMTTGECCFERVRSRSLRV